MLPHEKPSEHVCRHLACLDPVPVNGGGGEGGARWGRPQRLPGAARHHHGAADGSGMCEAGRGPTRRMLALNVTADGAARLQGSRGGRRLD